MNKIHLLSNEVVNKIAAGEVVERPGSVIKELVENSIDAQAKHITIEFEASGKKLIRVTDDGCGMSPEDTEMSVKRHTTSKIKDFPDLLKLSTMGFRGEALSSIAAVSKLDIVTRIEDSQTGWDINVSGGKLVNKREIGAPKGTTIEVKDIFFNTPARRKFLKSDQAERVNILHIIEELALSNPEIGFTVKSDKKTIINAPAVSPSASNHKERIIDIMGNEVYNGTIYFEKEQGDFKITGFISRIENSRLNKKMQYFFINRRPVTSRILSQALYDAYRASLPVNRHPMAMIFIQTNPEDVDVNVHPTKRLVKFSYEKGIYELLNQTIRERLVKQTSPIFHLSESKTTTYIEQTTLQLSRETETMEHPLPILSTPSRIIGHLYNTYIILETPDGLTIMDQHAANERVLYEKFMKQSKPDIKPMAQNLIVPLTWETSPHETQLLKSHLEQLHRAGFVIEEFGKNTFIFKSYPIVFGEIKQVKDFINNFISALMNDFTDSSLKILAVEEKIVRSACRAAVKAKDHLSNNEISQLLNDLKRCSQPLCCPHGRPTTIHITTEELTKKFGRT